MAKRRDPDHVLRQMLLPSGKRIEVLRAVDPITQAHSGSAQGDRVRTPASPDACPGCASRLVYPVDWCAADDGGWRVDLRCPNCERIEVAVLDQEVAERFDEELERGAETLMSDLKRLTEANMSESLNRFRAALEADAIQPMDF